MTKTITMLCPMLLALLLFGALDLAPLRAHADSQAAPVAGAPAPPVIPPPTVGRVIETMNSSGYTYVRIDAGDQKMWAAAPGFEVAVGDEVSVPPGAPMRAFHSKTLDREFEEIFFVDHIQVIRRADGSVPEPSAAGHGEPHAAEAPVELDLSSIPKAEGGRTIAEILDAGAALAGEQVRVRGRVAKFIPRIMGTNFLHLRDGTATATGADDLTITTQQEVEVGDLVLVEGVVTADKDFGHGYVYELIVEDARVTKE